MFACTNSDPVHYQCEDYFRNPWVPGQILLAALWLMTCDLFIASVSHVPYIMWCKITERAKYSLRSFVYLKICFRVEHHTINCLNNHTPFLPKSKAKQKNQQIQKQLCCRGQSLDYLPEKKYFAWGGDLTSGTKRLQRQGIAELLASLGWLLVVSWFRSPWILML